MGFHVKERFLVVTDVHHFFQIQTSFEEILNLTAYACEEVRIQLGAINKFGLAPTSYSPHTSLSVEVYGGIISLCMDHNFPLKNIVLCD